MKNHPLKAKLPADSVSNGKAYFDNRELIRHWRVVAYSNGKFELPVSVRVSMGRSRNASTVYADIYISDSKGNRYFAGSGNAGGYGYCKESASIQEAISNAGITLYGTPYSGQKPDYKKQAYIGGVGETAIRHALEAIARACGYRKFTIV